jgi:sorbitol/mannitol transport system substrate-binding protein
MSKYRHKGWRLLAMFLAIGLVAAACGSDASDVVDSGTDAVEDAADDAAEAVDDAMDDDDAMEEEDHSDDAMDDDAMEDDAMEEVAMISDECNIPNPAEEVEIDVMGWEFPIISQYAEELEECEDGNYSFNVQFLDSAEAQDAMRLDGATGSPEFEIYQGSNSFIIELANSGALMPLNDLIEKYSAEYGLDQIDQAFFDFASKDGDIYAIPMVSNTMHVFYNEPKLAEIGVDVPTTFEEALAACPDIQAAGYDTGFLYMLSAGWAWSIEFSSVLGSQGVRFVDEATGQPNFNSPEGIAAANTLVDMLETCGGNAASTYSTDEIQAAFQTGEIILGHTWASRAAAMDDPEASTEVGNIQFAPALSSGGDILASPAYIDGYGIPVGVDPEIVDEIFLAILAASDAESQEAAAEFGLVTRSGVTNPNGPRDGAAAEASLVNGRGPDLPTAAAAIARAKVGDALITILDGTSVEDALAAAEAAYLEEAEAQGLLS